MFTFLWDFFFPVGHYEATAIALGFKVAASCPCKTIVVPAAPSPFRLNLPLKKKKSFGDWKRSISVRNQKKLMKSWRKFTKTTTETTNIENVNVCFHWDTLRDFLVSCTTTKIACFIFKQLWTPDLSMHSPCRGKFKNEKRYPVLSGLFYSMPQACRR